MNDEPLTIGGERGPKQTSFAVGRRSTSQVGDDADITRTDLEDPS